MKKNITLVIIIIAAVAAILVSAINIKGFSVTESSKKFKQEYESINDKVSEKSSKKNRSVNIPENNPMEYITAEKLVKKIDNKESFVVYFGFSECPWCRSVIEELITTAQEENIRKIYYESWNILIDQDINFEKRVKNPPDNMINTLISYVNTLVYTKVLSAIYNTQLNPTVSYLHEPGSRRFSLSLDIAEIFKPIIGDRLIFSLLNKKQITEKSFTKDLNYLHLTKEASRTIVAELDKKLQTTIKHKELNKNVSYEYLMKLECYKLIKHLLGEKEYEPFKIWW